MASQGDRGSFGARGPERTLRIEQSDDAREEIVESLKAPLRPCLVVIVGPDVGRRVTVESAATLGRDPDAELSLTDPRVSWHHARLEDRGDGWAVVDEGSTNGMRVNDERCSERLLSRNDKITLGNTVVRFEVQDASDQAYDEMVQRMISVDDLTGLYVRRRFDQELGPMLASCGARERPVGMLVMDMDGLKDINDRHGHLFGAYVIGEVGRLIGRLLEGRGIAARFGGDEFVAAVPELDLAATRGLGEEIRRTVAEHPFEHEGVSLSPGLSIGIASFPESAQSATALFHRADEALYRAKRGGKNRVCE